MRSTSSKLIATVVTALAVTVAGAALHRSSRVTIGGAPLAAANRAALERELEANIPANVRLTVVIEDRVVGGPLYSALSTQNSELVMPRAARTR